MDGVSGLKKNNKIWGWMVREGNNFNKSMKIIEGLKPDMRNG
jgi:hypothetical protein